MIRLWIAECGGENFWIKAESERAAKKIFKEFVVSKAFWETENEVSEEQKTFGLDLYKKFKFSECPGIIPNQIRGDVMIDITNPAEDWIWQK